MNSLMIEYMRKLLKSYLKAFTKRQTSQPRCSLSERRQAKISFGGWCCLSQVYRRFDTAKSIDNAKAESGIENIAGISEVVFRLLIYL